MDEKELIKLAKEGNQSAFGQLLEKYTGLIISIAKQFCFDSIQLDDLIQEGNMGFYKAIQKYDPDKGSTLSSYSYNYIKGAIFDFIKEETLKGIPDSTINKYFAYRKAKQDFLQDYEYEPDYSELAEYLDDGTTPKEIEEVFDLCNRVTISAGESTDVVVYRNSSDGETLLDTIEIENDEKDEEVEIDNDDKDEAIEMESSDNCSNSQYEKYRNILTDIEYKVMVSIETNSSRRNSLNSNNLTTTLYDDVKKEIGLSEYKIRKIECIALRKIRRFNGN